MCGGQSRAITSVKCWNCEADRGGCWRRVSQLSYPELDLRDRSGIRARAGWPPPLLGPAAGMVYKCKDTFNDCNSVKLRPGCDQ